jgi:hypothetical protein
MSDLDRLERCPRTGKMMHPTRQSALGQLASLVRAGKGDSNTCPFVCRFCQAWHLGHDRKRFNEAGEAALRNALASGRLNATAARRARRR